MKINSFKLVDNGRKGIKITTSENVVKDGLTVVDDVERHRQIPVTDMLRKKVQELKAVYLKICMYWVPDFDIVWDPVECIVKEKKNFENVYKRLVHLMQCVQINGVKLVGARFMIMGQITVSENGHVISPTTPLMGPEDTEFYDESWEKIVDVKRAIKEYLESAKVELNAKQYLLPLYEKNKEDLDNMTDEEAEKQAIELLQDKGFVVISEDEVMELTEEGIKDEEKPKSGRKKKNELPALNEDGEEGEKKRKTVVKDKFIKDTF